MRDGDGDFEGMGAMRDGGGLQLNGGCERLGGAVRWYCEGALAVRGWG